MELSSSSFHHMKPMPSRYASRGITGGENISPALAWTEVPSASSSLALSVIDIHPVANNWMHWLVIDIRPNVRSLMEGASADRMPPGSTQLYNTFSAIGYGGPMPPRGSGLHKYVFTLYALDLPALDLPLHTSLSAFTTAIDGHVLASASMTGVFER